MKFMIHTATMVSALALGIVGAQAADLTYEPAPVVEAPAAFNWTGFYIGVHGGAAVGDFKYPVSASLGDTNIGGELKQDASGGFGGVQVGYNWQFNPNWVLGVEADIAASSYQGKISGNVGNNFGNINFEAGTEVEWFGTVRGRIGYAFDQVLLYGTGGYAWSDNRLSATLLGLTASDSQFHSGWVVGAGVEVMFAPKWSVKAEYLYKSLEGKTYFSGIAPLPVGTINLNSVQVGVNYHF